MPGGLSCTAILPYSSSGAYPGSCRLIHNSIYLDALALQEALRKKTNTEFTESKKQAWHYARLANSVPSLRGLGLGVNMVPPLPLHFVQGKRGGLRCFVPDGVGAHERPL